MKIEVNEETGAHRVIAGWKPNDPDADGRVQEGTLYSFLTLMEVILKSIP